MTSSMSAEDLRRIVALYEMTKRASVAGADQHTKNEGANATAALLALLGKHGLDLVDIPDLLRRHEQNEAAKSAKTASTMATDAGQPNVLELVIHVLKCYGDMAPHEYIGHALWLLSTHVSDHFQVFPRLALLSPVKRCGKSKMLRLTAKLVANPELHDNISAAGLYHLIEKTDPRPVMLLDEGDNAGLKLNSALRAVLNSGFLKDALITRIIKGEPKKFSTSASVAIAAIGTLPIPLLDRSVILRMHRSTRTDLKTLADLGSPEEIRRLDSLHGLIVSWAQSITEFDRKPTLPKISRDRHSDIWAVLLAIANSFNSTYWSKVAYDAAIAFAEGYSDEDAAVTLLYDIRTIFGRLNVDRIKSATLAEMLNGMEDGYGIWNAWCGENDDRPPHAINQGEIATLLRRFDRNLRPQSLNALGSREARGKTGRGYYRKQFEPWWARYCPEKTGDEETADILPFPKAESKSGSKE
jgi:hypothetical protein